MSSHLERNAVPTSVSGRPLPAHSAGGQDVPGVIAPPPLIYVVGLAAGFGLEALLDSPSLPGALAWPVGAALMVTGGALARSFFRAFGRAGTPVSPYSTSTKLVTTGAYRLSRNPGYLGMALAYAGIAVIAGALWAFASLVVVLVLIDRGVIVREERFLERKFGEDYLRYKRRTRRWL
jgi:protein-S-isoprenylcysteine O-methyltransferase Ste14